MTSHTFLPLKQNVLMAERPTQHSACHSCASDTAVTHLHGSALAEVVRKAVDGEAAPHATQRVSGSTSPATLPNGECGVFEGQSPSLAGPKGDGLDILASNVTPHPKRNGHFKSIRHSMRRTAGRILPYERVATCGSKTLGGVVTLHKASTGSHYGGLTTCSSVWHCPVCAAKIGERRKEDVETILNRHHDTGGNAYMMTLTIPHYVAQRPKELLNVVRNVWRKVKQGEPWKRAKAKFGHLGDVRALEVTHGGNGWHPHLHVLLFLDKDTGEEFAQQFGFWMFERWARFVEKMGHGPCSHNAFTFDKASRDKGAAEYVGKWGVASEITKAHIKNGKGGRTPWQILMDAQGGNPKDVKLFKDYALAFKGARQLTWSRAIRKLYGLGEELPDEELAIEETPEETHTASIHPLLWKQVYRNHLTATILNAIDEGGIEAVENVFMAKNIDIQIVRMTSLDPTREVPLLIPRDLPNPQNSADGNSQYSKHYKKKRLENSEIKSPCHDGRENNQTNL